MGDIEKNISQERQIDVREREMESERDQEEHVGSSWSGI